MAVHGFPNLFMLYGPNTNLGHNSIIFMIECQANYVMDCLRQMDERNLQAHQVHGVRQEYAQRVRSLRGLEGEGPAHAPLELSRELRRTAIEAQRKQLLKLRAFRRSPMAFGGCFHDLSHLDGPFHAGAIDVWRINEEPRPSCGFDHLLRPPR